MVADGATSETIHETVRQHYAAAAVRASRGDCCAPGDEDIGSELYSALDRSELPDAAVLASLGCGNPTAVADLREGERRVAGSTSCCPPGGSGRPAAPSGWT